MKYIAMITIAVLSTSALAGGREHEMNRPTSSSKGIGVGVGIASSRSSSRSAAFAGSVAGSKSVGTVNSLVSIKDGDYGDMVPSVNAYAPAPTVSCYKTGGASINVAGFGGGIGGGSIDEGCEMREYVRLGQADSDPGVRALASQVLAEKLIGYTEQEEEKNKAADNDSVSNFERISAN